MELRWKGFWREKEQEWDFKKGNCWQETLHIRIKFSNVLHTHTPTHQINALSGLHNESSSSSQKKHLNYFSINFSPRWTFRSDVMSSNSSRYPGDGLIHRSGNTDDSLWTWWWELTRHQPNIIWNMTFWKYFTSFKMDGF